MTLVALVRHGETDFNKNKIIQGRFDIPLNDLGKEQAKKTSKNFADINFDIIISSPLKRALETAHIIASQINYTDDIIIEEAFIERNFGEADGKNVDLYVDDIFKDNVKGLEKEEEIKQRIFSGIDRVCKTYENKNIMVVCHSHSIKAMLASVNPNEYNFKTFLTNCSITFLEKKENDFEIKKVNHNEYL